MFVIVAVISVYVFRAILISWSSQETRSGIDINLDRALEEIVRDLREAKEINSVNNDEVRFTQDQAAYYIYYLYNQNDSYPLSFSQASYEIRKALLAGGINGSFTYGSGQSILTNVASPPLSDLSISGNLATIDLSILRKDETIRSKTKVRPRNL
jgi:Tfp pilus assembly protein PilW